jgi:hypothetical protein
MALFGVLEYFIVRAVIKEGPLVETLDNLVDAPLHLFLILADSRAAVCGARAPPRAAARR